jgi:uncharacterized protein (TIGR03435 family)
MAARSIELRAKLRSPEPSWHPPCALFLKTIRSTARPSSMTSRQTTLFILSCCFLLSTDGLSSQTPADQKASLPAFEQATLKPSTSSGDTGTLKLSAEGLLSGVNLRLTTLIQQAYRVNPHDITAPPWFADRYDLEAKAPEGADFEAVRPMLRSFLDRELKLQVHTEPRLVDAYSLTALKERPNLAAATPDANPGCRPADPGGSAGGNHVQCANVTMGDFAKLLDNLAPGYIDRSVVDETGLTGSFDFRLDWVAKKNVATLGGPTLFDALEKLGLQLQMKKLTVPTLVVDHADKPTPGN